MDVYRTAFFKCIECNFKFSLLGAQNKYEINGECPSCMGIVDYMSKSERENYIEEIRSDLKYL